MSQESIRNFAIIAHIDHGKSTLADRLLEATGTIPPREMRKQFLDNMELEREKGITIKLKTVRMLYQLQPTTYNLNLIDTPGHVDFSYEVSRSLAACEGALLLVDASQGVQAQTVSNAYKALDLGLTLIPIVSKIDLEFADPKEVAQELQDHFGFTAEEILFISAKENRGTDEVLAAIVERIPAPSGSSEAPLRALVVDSFYDEHRGVIAIIRVVDGRYEIRDTKYKIRFLGSGATCEPLEVGYCVPDLQPCQELATGEVGYIATGLKDISQVRVGDTITQLPTVHGLRSAVTLDPPRQTRRGIESNEEAVGSGDSTAPSTSLGLQNDKIEAVVPLLGYREPKAVVFANIFPVDKDDFDRLKDALGKLTLNDAALNHRPTSSLALGRGFELGLLGTLHLEIVKERLEREYALDLVVTAPTVEYQLKVPASSRGERSAKPSTRAQAEGFKIKSPSELPDRCDEIWEPWAKVEIITPYQFMGEVLQLVSDTRGKFTDQIHLGEKRLKILAEVPLAELMATFYDRLESASSGFASLDWSFKDYQPVVAGKLEILVNREVVEPFSRIVVKERASDIGRRTVTKLKEILPREQFAVPLQAVFNGEIIAREDLPAFRKDVTAKLYGGDQTRKDKLLKKQKKGKKELAEVGRVRIPKDAFRDVLEV